MNKIRKLLIFSCCIMIAAFAALWVSCKNSIPLVAEEPQVGVTQPTLTISSVKKAGDKLTVGINTENIPGSTKTGTKNGKPIYDPEEKIIAENASKKWISVTIYNDKELFRFVQGYDTMPQEASYDLDLGEELSATLDVFNCHIYARASYDGDITNMIKSNMVDKTGTVIVNNKSEYNGEKQSIPEDVDPYKSFALNHNNLKITYRKVDKTSNVESPDETSDVTNAGKYRVYSELNLGTFYGDGFPVGEPEPTKRPIGYFEITPIDLSEKATVELSKNEVMYSGKDFKSDATVTVTYNGTKYEKDTIYDVVYPGDEDDGDMINAGKKEIKVKFKGNYTGIVTKTFTINPKNVLEDTSLIAKLEEPSTVVCTGDTWAPEVTVSLNGVTLSEGTDYELIFPTDMIREGKKQIIVKFKGNYSGEKTLTGEILSNGWGKLIIDDDYRYWVDEDGTTSARITKGKNIWLKESSDGESTWYGLDNTNSVFTEGSRFWVKWLGRENDKEEWDKYYEQLDDEHKKKVEDNKLWIFLCGVTDPDGNEYTSLATSTNLYVQLGSDWDKDDVQAVFISQAIDEPVESIEYMSDFKNSPTGTGDYAKLKLKHFSPYAVYDELTDEEREMLDKILNGDISEDELNNMISESEPNEPTVPDNNDSLNNFESSEPSISYITGDQRGYVIAIAVCALIVAGVTLLFSLKSKKNKK